MATEDHPYQRAARNAWTVSQWKRERFEVTYPEYRAEVLDPDGTRAEGPGHGDEGPDRGWRAQPSRVFSPCVDSWCAPNRHRRPVTSRDQRLYARRACLRTVRV